jgi:hypothetical protein
VERVIEVNIIKVLYMHYENRIMKPLKTVLRRIRKSNRRDEFYQSTLYAL